MSDEKEVWAVVELMGHVKLAGRLTEEEKFGTKMGRLDIPTTSPCSCANGSKLLDRPVGVEKIAGRPLQGSDR